MSNSQQKQSWSLQDNERSKDQRDRFKPTGKQPGNYTGYYILSAIFVMLLISVILTLSSKQTLEACLFTGFCFNSKDNVVLYTLYVFATLFIIVFAIISAYLIGKKIGESYK